MIMTLSSQRHVVILGNGITGVTVARNLRKRTNDRITVISAETDHHYARTALMYIFMGDLSYKDTKPYEDDFWEKNRIVLKRGWVQNIETDRKRLFFTDGTTLAYDVLVVATGSVSNRFGWPGQEIQGVQCMYSVDDVGLLEANVRQARRAVIVGGGLIGVELAEMLLTRGLAVTFLVRDKWFWKIALPMEEGKLIARYITEHGIDLRLETELKEILADANGRARAVVTGKGEEIACEVVGLTVGVSPNTNIVKKSGIECDRGVLVDQYFRTSTPHVWAGGDCVQHRQAPPGRRPVEQVWYTGKIHGEHIAANLCGDERAYDPGVWFNSAKFLDIEYQTYGLVPSQLPEGVESFYWEDQTGKRSLRVNFRSDTGAVCGVNVFGMRHRHAVWETWIGQRATVSEVMSYLGAADFNPEFFRAAEPAILEAFNRLFPARAVKLRTPKGLSSSYIRRLLGSENASKPTLFTP